MDDDRHLIAPVPLEGKESAADGIATDETVDLGELDASVGAVSPLMPSPLDESQSGLNEWLVSEAPRAADSMDEPGPFTQGMAPVSPLISGRYRTLGLVGRGSTGRVYRVFDVELEEVVALKVVRDDLIDVPDVVERFRREVKLARRVTHPHVARTYDIGEHTGHPFMTMEFVDGPTLRDVITRRAPLSLRETARIGRMLCAGLGAAHGVGIVHRDLKPDNVLLRANGEAVITDFGIAHAFTGGSQGSGRLFVGTPAYMAPEQVEGKASADARADIYALGLILYEMLSGQRVWMGTSPVDIATARLRKAPPDPGSTLPELPWFVADLLRRCMAIDRDARPASTGEIDEFLAAILTGDETGGTGVLPRVVRSHETQAVAVLPFTDRGEMDAHLIEGLTEDIIDVLSMTPDIRVRPLGAVDAYRSPGIDARAAGQALGVDAVVSGRIARRGEVLRIRARVTTVADGFQLWAGRFECPVNDMLEVADAVGVAVAEALTVAPRPEASHLPSPADAEAVDVFLRGRYQLRRYWYEDVRESLRSFDAALERAPNDPRILSAAAVARARMVFLGTEGVEAGILLRASELALRARSLAPERPEPYFAHALVLFYGGQPAQAVVQLEQALQRSPGDHDSHDLLGRILLETGPLEKARFHLETALQSDPGAYGTRWDLARAHAFAGDWISVDGLLALAVDDRQHAWVRTGIRSRLDVWREAPVWCHAPLPEGSGGLMEPVIRLLRSASTDGLSRTIYDQIDAQARIAATSAPRRALLMYQFAAEFRGRAGDAEGCLDAIEAALAHGLADLMWLEACPVLRFVGDTPRFATARRAIRRRIGRLA